ncbi:MAG: acyl-CoA thioesterase [Desulfuromonas sp.]|nr:acyl-CoA thioesterase [Desulfuromonas sp.]
MDGFTFVIDYSVRIADINYGGHVANSAVLNFFQDARIAFLDHLGGFSEMDIGGCGVILPEAHVYYRQEMLLGDQLKIGVRIKELKRSSLVLEYRIERDGVVTAEGDTALVAYDYDKKKPRRLPEAFVDGCRNISGAINGEEG